MQGFEVVILAILSITYLQTQETGPDDPGGPFQAYVSSIQVHHLHCEKSQPQPSIDSIFPMTSSSFLPHHQADSWWIADDYFKNK